MDLECNGRDCDQTCKANRCKMNCSGGKCKKQKCEGEGNICEMEVECKGKDCDQTCEANRCKMNCSWLLYSSPLVMFLDNGNPCFWKFHVMVPFDTFLVNCLFDPVCVAVGILSSKTNQLMKEGGC